MLSDNNQFMIIMEEQSYLAQAFIEAFEKQKFKVQIINIAAASAITIPLLNNLFIILVPPDFLFTGCLV